MFSSRITLELLRMHHAQHPFAEIETSKLVSPLILIVISIGTSGHRALPNISTVISDIRIKTWHRATLVFIAHSFVFSVGA